MKYIKSILRDVLITSGVMMISPMPAKKPGENKWIKQDKARCVKIGFESTKYNSH